MGSFGRKVARSQAKKALPVALEGISQLGALKDVLSDLQKSTESFDPEKVAEAVVICQRLEASVRYEFARQREVMIRLYGELLGSGRAKELVAKFEAEFDAEQARTENTDGTT